ncbi:MAG: SPOR domain-containing protein [Flavobacteriales bacterium]
MGIERDLHDLLYCHDCVIVPQWGGFLTHYRSARLDEARKLVHPPGKDLSFNRHLVRNDGLLADHMAKREGIGFDVATARIDAEVEGWRNTLERSGRLELPSIGVFFHDAEQNLQFDPDKRTSYWKDAFGLRPLAAVPVERVKPGPIVRELPKPAPVVTSTDRKTPMLWAAATLAAVVFGSAAFYAYRLGGTGTQWSSLDPFGPDPKPLYVANAETERPVVTSAGVFALPEGPLGVQVLPLTPNDSVTLTVDLGQPAPVEAVRDTTSVMVPKAEVNLPNARFHVIGGCFAQPENAEKLLAELRAKGYPAVQLKQYGQLTPVAYGSYVSRKDALDAMAAIRKDGAAAAWLLVR